MHASVMAFGTRVLTPEMIEGKKVLEVGSLDVNGTLRYHIINMRPAKYIGVDQTSGPGVDHVMFAEDVMRKIGREKADVVICTEVLEHSKNWETVVANLKGVLKPEGYLLCTTRSEGFPFHDHTGDYWRYSLDDFRKIFCDLDIITLESDPQPSHPGVFMLARKPKNFIEKPPTIELATAPQP